ncbi:MULTISPECIES: SIS domain-containing protein [Vibrio]|uniref:SIS domain-containing protein n=1 Tax=Vibrio TaxID=662 RepID=UPI000B5C62BD|nr:MULTISPECIES: SIS domain-containing protein [Vibrio]HBV76487.1 SIS domain-containing protein [Vibrio sp.]
MSVFHKMMKQRESFSISGRKIIDWISHNPELACHSTSQEMADFIEVSQSSIVKLTQKLGYKGYSQFKLAINEDFIRRNSAQVTPLHHDILSDDPLTVIAQKLVQTKIDAMVNTTNALSMEVCDQAIRWIDAAQRVQIVGIGGSALTAKDLSYKLLKLGITALTESDTHVQVAVARILTPQDIQIVISFSGDKKEVLLAAETAKQQGAKVIALTSPKSSKLRKIADLCFDTIADESENRSSSIASRTAQNVITDLLFIHLIQYKEDIARVLIDEIRSDVERFSSK